MKKNLKTKEFDLDSNKEMKLPQLLFHSKLEWDRWLKKNHRQSNGIWLIFHKKGIEPKSVTYSEALDSAICYGWIDGQKNSLDEKSWLQRFTPRRARSLWSKKNTEHAERLIKSGKMRASGLAEIDAAKSDGRWNSAYDSQKNAKIPDDFLKALKRNKEAYRFFVTLNKANLYAIAYRLQTAKKPETRLRRMKMILEMMANGESFHN